MIAEIVATALFRDGQIVWRWFSLWGAADRYPGQDFLHSLISSLIHTNNEKDTCLLVSTNLISADGCRWLKKDDSYRVLRLYPHSLPASNQTWRLLGNLGTSPKNSVYRDDDLISSLLMCPFLVTLWIISARYPSKNIKIKQSKDFRGGLNSTKSVENKVQLDKICGMSGGRKNTKLEKHQKTTQNRRNLRVTHQRKTSWTGHF